MIIVFCSRDTRDLYVTEVDKVSRISALSVNGTDHGVFLPVPVGDHIMKIHESAAFRNTWHTVFYGTSHRFKHRSILRKLLKPQFRVAASEKDRIGTFGDLRIMYRRKTDDLHA